MDKNNCVKQKKYTKNQIDYVRSKVSFKGPISSTLMDFWIDWKRRYEKK